MMRSSPPTEPLPAGDSLVALAIEARCAAYAPYSRFAVGAAVRTVEGELYAGCNMENAAYPEGVCAEAGALAAMVLAGGRTVTDVVVAAEGPEPCTPCGGCRQKLREFGTAATRVRMVDGSGRLRMERSLGELLPDSFGPGAFGR